jgi:serine/threonine protein kinase
MCLGDLRCSNILLTEDYDVKVSDFGISLLAGTNYTQERLKTVYWYRAVYKISEEDLLKDDNQFKQVLDVR